MKPILLAVTLLASALLSGFGQEKKATSAVEETVLKLEQQWDDALIKSDTAALDRLYDERLIYTHSNAKVDNKTSYLQAIQSGATKYESMKRDDIKVTVYGQTALVTCHWEVHVSAQGKKIDTNARYLHVWIRQPAGWKLVAHEATRIAP